MSKNLRDLLKEETYPFHKKLEETKISSKLAKAELSKDEYIFYLKTMESLHEELEPFIGAFRGFESMNLDPTKRCRLGLVRKDIEILGAQTNTSEEKNFDLSKLNSPLDFESAVGWLYVLEGSTMGGGFLAPRLSHFKNDNDEVATNYFLAYGKDTPIMWKEYVEFLDLVNENENIDNKKIVNASINLFKYLIEVMDG